MIAYKEWGYELFPGLAFEDLACRTEKLGSRLRTRSLVGELREKERDRVIGGKYGPSAVADVHAREAAKVAAKEAAVEEKREDDELAISRYMDVDEEGPGGSTPGGGGGSGGEDKSAGSKAPSGLSAEVRERMEKNRRFALERLRLKKEEVAAAAAATAVAENEAAQAGTPVDDGDDVDMMDVDAGGEGANDNDNFDDDEAALAEMEAEEIAKKPKPSMSTEMPELNVTEPALATATAASAPLSPETDNAAITDSSDILRSTGVDGETLLELSNRADEAIEGVAGGSCSAAADGAARTSDVGGETARGAEDAVAMSTEGASVAAMNNSAEAVSGEAPAEPTERKNACPQATLPAAASAEGGPASVLLGSHADAAEGAGRVAARTEGYGSVAEASFSSPSKCMLAAGAGPLSPLGSLFASVDVPAEGGLATVRAPLGGLFSDQNTT